MKGNVFGPRGKPASAKRALLPTPRCVLALAGWAWRIRVRGGSTLGEKPRKAAAREGQMCRAVPGLGPAGRENTASPVPLRERGLGPPAVGRSRCRPVFMETLGSKRPKRMLCCAGSWGRGLPAGRLCHLQASAPPTLEPRGLMAPGTAPIPGDPKGAALISSLPKNGPPACPAHTALVCAPPTLCCQPHPVRGGGGTY